MFIGILCGLSTCALWGLTFIAARAVAPFTTWDLVASRYLTFALVSLALMLHPRFRPTGFAPQRWVLGLSLGGFGYVGYFLGVAFAVELAGPAIPPLVIGAMPVVLALIANWRDRTIAWRPLALPLGLISMGLAVVNTGTLAAGTAADRIDLFLGLLAALAALSLWVVYGLVNTAVMRAPDAPDGFRWTGLQGIGAGLGALCLLPQTGYGLVASGPADESLRFLGWTLLMGIAGAWLTTWLWIIASRRLPLALLAQLVVAETVFGLIFGFRFEGRWPSPAEWTGAVLQIAGLVAAISLFTGRNAKSSPA